MVEIHKQGKPRFLKPEDVEKGDLLRLIDVPYVQPSDKSKFGKIRTVLTVVIVRTGEVRRWGLNTTTNDIFVDAWTIHGDKWKGKECTVEKRLEKVSGVDKFVLYGKPSEQQEITTEKPSAVALEVS